MRRSHSSQDTQPGEYRYHVQHPAPKTKPLRVGMPSAERGGRPGDTAFQRHIRTFTIVAVFMVAFLGITVFTAIKSWQIRHTRVTRHIPKEDTPENSMWRTSPSSSGVAPSASPTTEADTIHQAEILARQAELMVEATNYREAITLYSDAIHVWPDLATAYPRLGRLLLETGNDQRAQIALERAAELFPASADILNDLGVAYLRMNRFDRALTQFETALTIAPDHGPALFNQSLCLRATGRLAEARRVLDQYLVRRPNDPQGLKEKAFFIATEGHYEGALALLEQIIAAFPAWPPAYFDAAATAALMKDTDHAIRFLRKVESLTSPAAVYLVYQQPAFNEVRLSEAGKIFQRDLVRRAQSAGAPARPPPGSRGAPEPMLSDVTE